MVDWDVPCLQISFLDFFLSLCFPFFISSLLSFCIPYLPLFEHNNEHFVRLSVVHAPSLQSILASILTSLFSLSHENSPHNNSSSPCGQSGTPLHTCDTFTQVRLSHRKLPGQGGIRVEPSIQRELLSVSINLLPVA